MKRMMCTAVIAATALGAAGALAQPASNTANPTPEQQKGMSSGPATGSPATLGTGGQTPVTPHQSEVLRNRGGPTVQQEEGQKGATNPAK
jgi:Spy/CpxP family protein refolding chaperone